MAEQWKEKGRRKARIWNRDHANGTGRRDERRDLHGVMAALEMGGVRMCWVLKAVRAAWRAAARTGVVTWFPGPGPGPGPGAGRWDARWRYRCMGCREVAGGSAMTGHTPSGHGTGCRDLGCKRGYLAGAKTWPRVATNQSQQMANSAIRSSRSMPSFLVRPSAKCQVPSRFPTGDI